MRKTPLFKDHNDLHMEKSKKSVHRSMFSLGLALRMISVMAVLLIGGSLLYGQSRSDALFIVKEIKQCDFGIPSNGLHLPDRFGRLSFFSSFRLW